MQLSKKIRLKYMNYLFFRRFILFLIILIIPFRIGHSQQDKLKIISCEISALVDFEKQKIWFSTNSKDRIFLSINGSVLHLDDLLDINGEDACIRPYSVQQGAQWLMAIKNGKPSIFHGVEIMTFRKTQEIFNKMGFIELSAPIYRLSKDSVLTGPYILEKRIRITAVKPGDIDEERLLLIPVK